MIRHGIASEDNDIKKYTEKFSIIFLIQDSILFILGSKILKNEDTEITKILHDDILLDNKLELLRIFMLL